MTPSESDLGAIQCESDPRPSRLKVFPGIALPQAFAEVAGVALLATAMLLMVAGVIQGFTEAATPIFVGGQAGRLPIPVPRPSISVADRLSVFAHTGANLTVALLLVVAIVAVISYGRAGGASGLSRALVLLSVILASMVILANVAVAFELLRNATGVFSGFGQTNRAVELLQCSAPVALSIGVLCCAGTEA